ncbi:ATP-dependent DNA helicase [Trichonephila clavipes]|nr:ATP-dependent DNA helicase [Trichonephila clavipes]
MATVLQRSSILICNECTMAHKHSLEVLHRTLYDLNDNEKIFGVSVLLLCGDFRRTLQVIPRSTFAHEINVSLKQSFSWRNVETLRLTLNTRVQLQDDQSNEIFSIQLLDTGNSEAELHQNTQCIESPDNFSTVVLIEKELIESVFPDILYSYLGMPPHIICGSLVILLRNLNPPRFVAIRAWSSKELPGIFFKQPFSFYTRAFGDDHVILNHGQATCTTPELVPPLLTTTPHQRVLTPMPPPGFEHKPLFYRTLSSNTPTDCLNTDQSRTKNAELISYGWTAALQWVQSHVGSPHLASRSKTQAESRVVSTRSPLDLQKSKEHYFHIHWQIYYREPKIQEPWKAMIICGKLRLLPAFA